MLRQSHNWATRGGIVVAAGVLLLGQVSLAWGQADAPAPAGATDLEAPLLDSAHAQYAHGLVERWVRAGTVEEESPAAEQRVSDLFAVRVTLRQQGFTVGTGDAVRDDADAAIDDRGRATGLAELSRRATAAALAELRRNLQDARLRAQTDAQLQEAQERGLAQPTRTRELHEVTGGLLVDVQLARHPVTVRLPANPGPGAALGSFAPGFHGLRLVGARGKGAMIWPASALAHNVSPKSQLTQLLAEEGHGILDLPKIGVPGGPVLQRFEVVHVVRPSAGRSPVELVRGGIVLPPIAMNLRTLGDLSDRLALHLADRITAEGQVRGTYHPTRDGYEPALASGEDAAWAAYALSRYARRQRAAQPTARGDELGERALRVVARQARAAADQPPLEAAGASALLLLAITDDGLPDPAGGTRDALARRLMAVVEQAAEKQLAPPDNAADETATLNASTQALATAALAAWYDQTRDARAGEVIARSLDGIWTASKGRLSTGVMPWYAAALSRVGDRLAGDDAEALERLAERRAALAELASMLANQQVVDPPTIGPADVIGGFQLVPGPPGSPPAPNWYTAHLLHFIAIAIGDDGIAGEGDRFGWVITGGLAARFLGQLMFDEPSAYYLGDPRRAIRGVRLALWDNTQPVYTTAISLLAVTHLQESAERVLPAALDVGPGVLERREEEVPAR